MNNNQVETIIENLFLLLPVLHKKLLKIDLSNVQGYTHLSRPHLGIMGILSKNTLPISEIARKLLMPKPQVTRLINQLISSGIVAKQPDKRDRRRINIALTDHGQAVLKECRELLKSNIRKKLALSQRPGDRQAIPPSSQAG